MEETWKKAWTGTKCCYPCGQCMHCVPCSPSGGDVVGEGRGGADLSGEAEVGDLDGVAAGRQDVLGLEVAVEEAQAVHVRQALQKKEGCTLYRRL